MAHIGVLCPELSGHLHPMMSLARELLGRGHRITFYQRPITVERVQKAGFACRAYAEREFPIEQMQRDLRTLAGLDGRAALAFTARIFARQAAALMRDIPPMLKTDGIEFLLVDQTLGAGSTVAEAAGLPFIVVCNALALEREPDIPPFCLTWPYRPTRLGRLRNEIGYRLIHPLVKPVFKAMNRVRVIYGLPEINDFSALAGKARAIVSQLPRAFDFPRRELPGTFQYVGPMVDPHVRSASTFPYDRLDGRPIIYASMGTMQNGVARTFGIIARACDRLGAQLIIALGGGDPTELTQLAGNPIVVGFAPQLDLIRRSTLVVTHAGLNTALECLTEGVPMVAIPVTNDQPGVAARIRHTGVGEFVPMASLTTERLRKLVKQVLRTPSYRQRAQEQAAAIRTHGGARQGADVVERCL